MPRHARFKPPSCLAVYDVTTGTLLGLLCITIHGGSRDTLRFNWQPQPSFQGNPALFPEGWRQQPPPFVADFLHNFCGEAKDILWFLLHNHSGAQSAICFLESNSRPCKTLAAQVDRQLWTSRVAVQPPGRVVALVLDRLPKRSLRRARRIMRRSHSSLLAHALVLDGASGPKNVLLEASA